MSTDTSTTAIIEKQTDKIINEPGKYKVIFLNDNITPMEFVIGLLVQIFKHTEEAAKEITMQIHNTGSGCAGIYSYEIAEQKTTEANVCSRHQGFPLVIQIEKE